MGTISFSKVAFLIALFLFCTGLVEGDPVVSREALEIIIGGGSDPAPPPDDQSCPPPPPPPCPPPPSPLFESKRIEIVYPVIQKFKKKIKCDPFGYINSWTGTDICHKYKGFSCATVPDLGMKALYAVNFNEFGFCGSPDLPLDLEGFIDELPDLSIFHANSNNFTGTIPKKIANLRYLFELDLSNNKFTGKFPYEVLGARKLTFLDLRFNTFTDLIPPQVFTLDLDALFINNNNFAQCLPDNLGSLPVLFLTLANNKLTGPIPPSIGKACKTLVEVLFLKNQLTGCLPSEIGLLNKARVFDASDNLLTGPIPNSFACLAKMEILRLYGNQFYGTVPEQVCKLPNLSDFNLSYNYFTKVGPECCKLIDKKILDVKMNCIPGFPMQRSKAECDAFFSKPRRCPRENSFSWMPCKTHGNYPYSVSNPQSGESAPPLSYNALKPHRL